MGGRSTLDPPGGGAGREAPRLPRTLDPGATEARVTRSGNLLPTGLARSGPSPRGTHTHRGTHLPLPRTRPCLPPHWIHTLHCTLTHSWPARLHLHIRETYTLARGSHPASSAHAPRRTPPHTHTHHGNTVTRCHVSLERPVHLGHACHATPHTLIHPSTRSPTGSPTSHPHREAGRPLTPPNTGSHSSSHTHTFSV